jgi:ribosomal protein S26
MSSFHVEEYKWDGRPRCNKCAKVIPDGKGCCGSGVGNDSIMGTEAARELREMRLRNGWCVECGVDMVNGVCPSCDSGKSPRNSGYSVQ